jgi:hypothetical protein
LPDSDTVTETPALPGDALREGIVDRLRSALGESVVDTLIKPNDDVWVRVSTAAETVDRDRAGLHRR